MMNWREQEDTIVVDEAFIFQPNENGVVYI